MSGYPPASSYGPPPGLTSLTGSYQPQHSNNQQQQYQQYGNTQYDYSNNNSDPNASAFNNNNAYQGGYQNPVPPFSAAAVASGVPPLPIFPQWQMNNDPQQQQYGNTGWGPPPPPPPPHHEPQYPYQQHHQQQHQPQQPQHMHFDQQGYAPYNPYAAAGVNFADTSFNDTSGPSPMSYTPQPILHTQSQPPHSRPPSKYQQAFAPPTGPKPRPPPDESEISEGEYVPTPKRLPPRETTFRREGKSWGREKGDGNGRQPSNDHYSPTQHFRLPDSSRRSSRDSPVRGVRGGLGDYELKPKGTSAKARKEAAREIARQATRKSTPPDSRLQSLAGPPPVIEQLPLPKRPAQVPQALLDARAKAQNAVLNLISLKVRFQDYLDEGIDEKVVTKVFADVGLSPGPCDAPKVNSRLASKPATQPQPQPTVLPGFSVSPPPPPLPKAALPEKPAIALPPPKEDNGLGLGNRKPASILAASAGKKAEERKDRIARLMALKSGAKVEKPAEPAVEAAPPPPATIVAPVAAAVAPTAPIAPVVENPTKPVPSPAPMQHPLPPKPKAAEAPAAKVPEADVVVPAAPATVDTNALLRQRTEALQARQPVVDKTALLKKKMEEMEAKAKQNQAEKAAKEAAEKAAKDANLRERIAALNARNTGQEDLANQFAKQSVKTDPAQNFLAEMLPADMPGFNSFAQVQQTSFPPGLPSFPPPNGMPAIPGLFLGAQPAAPSPQLTVGLSTAPVNIRKRPVASDFDSGASTPSVYKKPFGHMDGQDKLILDVSESEDGESSEDDDRMDLDEVIDQYGRQANFPAKPSMRDLPPLSDFPPKRSYTAPTSTVGTPPVSQSMPRPAARPEDLKKKESAIAEMRRKIAEAEERRKAKLAAVGSSSSTSKTPTPPVATAFVDRIETSDQIERLMSDASRKIEEDQQNLAAAQMLQEQKAVDLEKAQEEQRRKRQVELAANPPAVNADLQESQRRLEELRAEMQRIEAGMQKKLDDQKRLAETMEKLNVEADKQLEAQKEQLKEINDDIAEVEHEQGDAIDDSESAEVDVPVATEGALADEGNGNQASSASESDNVSRQAENAVAKSPASIEQAEHAADEAQDDVANEVARRESSDVDTYEDAPNNVMNGSPAKSIEGNVVEMSSGSESTPMVESSESDRSSKSQERGVSVQERGSSSDSSDQSMDESSSPEMDIDEPLAELSTGAGDAQVHESSSSESSSSSEGSISSSEDDSDDDDSPHPDDGGNIQEEEMPDVSDTSSSGSSSSEESQSEEEEYEPPAAASPPAPVAAIARSASNSLALETISRPAASSPAVSTPRTIEDPPAPAAVEPAQRRPATVTSAEVINGSSAHRAPSQGSANKPSEAVKKSHFTPYESPLKLLHSYRFHPQFTKEVPGSYRSVTYSNNIRENDDFCRYELQGGTCNDEKCLDQHFREAGISDQAVLEILSNSKGLDKEEKMKWITGLKQVLGEMRAKKVSNFEGIAQGIVDFRRKFFAEKGTIVPPDASTSASTSA